MEKRKRRRSDRAGRPAMRSPGRPPVAGREEQQRFWKAIARGLSSEEAAVSCGVSSPVGGRWFREGGGMPPISLAPLSVRYLCFAEREEIAILRAQGARGARHCPSGSQSPVDCLTRPASQRGDSKRRSGVSGVDCAVAQPPTCQAAEDSQAGHERSTAALRAGPPRRHGQG